MAIVTFGVLGLFESLDMLLKYICSKFLFAPLFSFYWLVFSVSKHFEPEKLCLLESRSQVL